VVIHIAHEDVMKRAATFTVTVVEQDGWIDVLPNGQLTQTLREVVRLTAKEAVGEYIREIPNKHMERVSKAIKSTLPETGFVRLSEILKVTPIGPTCPDFPQAWSDGMSSVPSLKSFRRVVVI
jgi:hypothetical protein